MISGKAAQCKLFWIWYEKGLGEGIFLTEKCLDKLLLCRYEKS